MHTFSDFSRPPLFYSPIVKNSFVFAALIEKVTILEAAICHDSFWPAQGEAWSAKVTAWQGPPGPGRS